MPGDSILSTLQSTTLTGDPQPITLTTTGGRPDATVTLSSPTIQSDESATLTVETSPSTPFGYYPITLTASGTEDRTTTFGVTVGPPPPVLQSGVPLTGLAGQAGSDQIFAIDVPPNDLFFTIFDVTIGGGTGDADLYLRADAPPTDDAYDCRSDRSSGFDSCVLFNKPGTWFVRVHGFSAYAGLSLYATYANPSRMFRKEVRTDLAGAAGSQRFFWVTPPEGRHHLTVRISRTLGDADLHVRLFGLPSPIATECHKVRLGQHGETCTIKNPYPGTYYIGVYGVTDYSRLSAAPAA